jgi:hypothetical protein
MCGKQKVAPLKVDLYRELSKQADQSPVTSPLRDTSADLVQYRQLLLNQKEQIDLALHRMELLAIIGLPPGLDVDSKPKFVPPPQPLLGPDRRSTQTAQTTLIIRNIVGNCNRRMLVKFMNRHGFQGKYNLLYLPQRFPDQGCFHYAFVNFVSEDAASEFQAQLNGCDEEDLFGEQYADISWSRCQGLQANIEKFRNSSVMHPSVEEACRPLLLKDGKAIPFPKPTRRIKHDRRGRRETATCSETLSAESLSSS